MRGILFFVMGAFFCVLFAAVAQPPEARSFEVGPGGRLFGDVDVDALLTCPFHDHVPLASTGQCLWAAHPGGWAFPARTIHYYLITGFGIGYDLELSAGAQVILPSQMMSFPSHVTMSGGGNGIAIKGSKWIASDDVLSTHLELTNQKDQPVDVLVQLDLPVEPVESQDARVAWTVENEGMTIHVVGDVSAFTPVSAAPKADVVFKVEGESAAGQPGGGGKDSKKAASGGFVLGNNFGAMPGQYANYVFDVPEEHDNMVITIRYARALAGNADFLLQLPGRKRHPRVLFKDTGGWGNTPGEFGIVSYPVGAVPAGPYKVRLLAISANNNCNIDALYLHPNGTEIPGVHPPKTSFARTITVAPGKTETLDLHFAASTRPDDAEAALKRALQSSDPVADQVAAYNQWLTDNVPAFSGNRELTTQYWHRATSILRKNLFHVGEGHLKDWGISEGRWTSGWYANMISYGAGHQIRESRWLRDPRYVRGIISTWCANEKPDGVFPNYIRPNEIGTGQYTDWITSTVWDAYCVQPDEAVLRDWADALKRNVDGWLTVYDADHDGLLMVDSHWWTGMEWQPSFFFFNGFDKDKQNQKLERVDLTAYVYGSARNLSHILNALGDTDGAQHYATVADTIRDATVSTLWDPQTQYFYSVDPDSEKKAMVKEVVGVYPFYFSMFADLDGPYPAAWKSILDPKQFWTKWPVASASKQCPAYSQDTTFNGKEVGGCMWNGPTWPHANSIVLSAMAATLREYPDSPLRVADFYALLKSFTEAQFYKQDLNFPWTGEYYNGDTGEWRTDQRDYNHSTYLDIMIADVAGLRPRPDNVLEIHPLIDPAMGPWVLDGIRYHDHDVTIAWAPVTDNAPTPDELKGFRVYVDGTLVHHEPLVAWPVEIPLEG